MGFEGEIGFVKPRKWRGTSKGKGTEVSSSRGKGGTKAQRPTTARYLGCWDSVTSHPWTAT